MQIHVKEKLHCFDDVDSMRMLGERMYLRKSHDCDLAVMRRYRWAWENEKWGSKGFHFVMSQVLRIKETLIIILYDNPDQCAPNWREFFQKRL